MKTDEFHFSVINGFFLFFLKKGLTFSPRCVPSLKLSHAQNIFSWSFTKTPRVISKQILIDLFLLMLLHFLLKFKPHLAQSLMQWRNPKGQTLFKWHFDDISLARLTFGSFFFMHHILSSFYSFQHNTSNMNMAAKTLLNVDSRTTLK